MTSGKAAARTTPQVRGLADRPGLERSTAPRPSRWAGPSLTPKRAVRLLSTSADQGRSRTTASAVAMSTTASVRNPPPTRPVRIDPASSPRPTNGTTARVAGTKGGGDRDQQPESGHPDRWPDRGQGRAHPPSCASPRPAATVPRRRGPVRPSAPRPARCTAPGRPRRRSGPRPGPAPSPTAGPPGRRRADRGPGARAPGGAGGPRRRRTATVPASAEQGERRGAPVPRCPARRAASPTTRAATSARDRR